MASHAAGTVNVPPLPRWVGSLGEFGVRVFFVISGYLITTLLLAEHRKTGTISLKDFYVRRVYRIFPAFYTFIGVVALLSATGIVALGPGDLVHAVTFTMNYHEARAWWVGHLWSLSVEEQFYFLWPAALLFSGVRRGVWVAGAALVVAPAARVLVWILLPGVRPLVGEVFPAICDSIAVGCLLALARPWLDARPLYLRALRSPLAALFPVVALAIHQSYPYPSFYLPFGHTLVNVLLVLALDRVVRYPETPDGRLLNTAPLAYVGKLSYSLYLYQQLFLNRNVGSLPTTFPLNLALAAAAAAVSYYAIEQTFLNLRASTRHPRTPPVVGAGS
jgi:peptidoglycan/LPS O-acetylase OafA/YrhL